MPEANEIWAWIAIEDEGDEGVAAYMEDGTWRPMIGCAKEGIEGLRPIAEQIAKESGMTLQLRRFTTRTDLETINPEET